jgi:ribosomal-protein-alanine N-acetyltransferase
MPVLATPRLTLIPFTLDLAQAALRGNHQLGELLDITIPDSWPNADYREFLPLYAEGLARRPAEGEFSYLIVHSAARALIGDAGGKGGPDAAGVVELGYSIVPAYQRQGYATEAVRRLIGWIRQQPNVQLITAECLYDNHASTGVLRDVGMRQVAADARLLYWELPAQPARSSPHVALNVGESP